jgi:hypothetical protein
MRPVRILLVAIALIAVGLAGWALGARGGGQSGTDPGIAEAPSAAPDDQVAQDEGAGGNTPSVNAPSGGGGVSTGGPTHTSAATPPVDRPPKPVIRSISVVPYAPAIGGSLHLDPGPREVTFRFKISNATRVNAWIGPATKGDVKTVWLGEDRNGRDGWTTRLWYGSKPLNANVLVRATGPGGTGEAVFGVTSNGGADETTEEGAQEVTEEQTAPEDQKATEEVTEEVSEDQQP